MWYDSVGQVGVYDKIQVDFNMIQNVCKPNQLELSICILQNQCEQM